jgi:hypothetical protein
MQVSFYNIILFHARYIILILHPGQHVTPIEYEILLRVGTKFDRGSSFPFVPAYGKEVGCEQEPPRWKQPLGLLHQQVTMERERKQGL